MVSSCLSEALYSLSIAQVDGGIRFIRTALLASVVVCRGIPPSPFGLQHYIGVDMVYAQLLLGLRELKLECLLHLFVKVGYDNVWGSDAVPVEELADTVCKELERFKPLLVDYPECRVEDRTEASLACDLEQVT